MEVETMTKFWRNLCVISIAVAFVCLAASSQTTAPNTVTTLGLGGWAVQSSALATQTGAKISTPGFSTSTWLKVTPDDAGAPGTEVGAEVQNDKCPSVFFSTNMDTCFGYMNTIGPDTIAEFDVPWWFQTNFTPNLGTGQYAKLIINGVVGQADVWVNGTEVSTEAVVEGAFASYTFDITSLIKSGTNSLAFKLYPNNPMTMFTLGEFNNEVQWQSERQVDGMG
jgi:exo-1,4-beta-D-glucosaminidase